jgi:serine/threonine-protein kinase RsbT
VATVTKSSSYPVRSDADVVAVRQTARAWSTECGFTLVEQTKMVTAASELARNTLIYGGGGAADFEKLDDGRRKGLRITFSDEGPGIADIDRALRDGFTSGTGLGLGLGGARRLVNDFNISSEVGKGTRVMIARWK